MNGDDAYPVRALGISALVRSRQEIVQARDALALLEVPSVCPSNCDSIFETLEAQEILWPLRAVVTSERENALRSALVTLMMGLNALDTEAPNNDEYAQDAVVEEFDDYR